MPAVNVVYLPFQSSDVINEALRMCQRNLEELLNRCQLKAIHDFLQACLGIVLHAVLCLAGVCGLPKQVVKVAENLP